MALVKVFEEGLDSKAVAIDTERGLGTRGMVKGTSNIKMDPLNVLFNELLKEGSSTARSSEGGLVGVY